MAIGYLAIVMDLTKTSRISDNLCYITSARRRKTRNNTFFRKSHVKEEKLRNCYKICNSLILITFLLPVNPGLFWTMTRREVLSLWKYWTLRSG